MSSYNEPINELRKIDRDYSRALNSLKEEVEAIDYYQQRVATTDDPELKKILAHNRDEEIEHAVMVLEWLRRNMPGWDKEMRGYLFTTSPITELENDDSSDRGDLKIRDLS